MECCLPTQTGLPPADARLILEPYFTAVQEAFVEAGLAKCRRTKLRVESWVHDSPRHFAGCKATGLTIVVAPEMVELPEETVAAIMAHELGHAADFLYPGEFVLGRGGAIRRSAEDMSSSSWAKWMRDWDGRDDHTVELVADAIAERVLGRTIGYAGPCLLQTFDKGIPRPESLR